MNDTILNDDLLTENEPLSPDGLIANLLQDLNADCGPDAIADEFIEEFVLSDRPEASQVMEMLEMPSYTLVEMLKAMVGLGYEAQIEKLDAQGVQFLDRVKSAVKEKMTTLASDTA